MSAHPSCPRGSGLKRHGRLPTSATPRLPIPARLSRFLHLCLVRAPAPPGRRGVESSTWPRPSKGLFLCPAPSLQLPVPGACLLAWPWGARTLQVGGPGLIHEHVQSLQATARPPTENLSELAAFHWASHSPCRRAE